MYLPVFSYFTNTGACLNNDFYLLTILFDFILLIYILFVSSFKYNDCMNVIIVMSCINSVQILSVDSMSVSKELYVNF